MRDPGLLLTLMRPVFSKMNAEVIQESTNGQISWDALLQHLLMPDFLAAEAELCLPVHTKSLKNVISLTNVISSPSQPFLCFLVLLGRPPS